MNDKILQRTYFALKAIFWVLYIATMVGIWKKAPQYLSVIDDVLKIVVGAILGYLFNPWRKTKCTKFHRQVVFTSALILLASSSLKPFLQSVPIVKNVIPHNNTNL